MDHLIIVLHISGLIAGIAAAFYLFAQNKVYNYSFLKTYIYNIVFLNLIIFTKIISRYYKINIFNDVRLTLDIETAHLAGDIILITSTGIEIFASLGLVYTFLKIIFEIQDLALGRKVMYFLITYAAVASITFGICIAEFLYNQNPSWLHRSLDILGSGLSLVIMFSLFSGLIRRQPDLSENRIIFLRSYSIFYLICIPTLFILDMLNYQYEYLTEAFIVISVNIFPLIWVKFIISRYSNNNAPILFSKLNIDNLVSLHNVTPREREIFELILKGYSNIEIQNELFISPHTVKNHNYNIYKKLGIRSRGELIRKVMDSENGS
ncbi:MAG: helix-turn-helix transcriptional regulator [bacterium]|nr:helix-turn-helix transcriptional regulator [bacterium]